jgi:hypothetical protein
MRAGSFRPGGLIGLSLLLAALGVLALSPRARTTVAAQAAVALGRRPGWLQAALGGPRPRLERLLAAVPDDVELQIGGATLPPVKAEGAEPVPEAPPRQTDDSREILTRLDEVARRFPNDAAVRAHRLRHMARSAVWLKRLEEAQFGASGSQPAASDAGKPPPTEALRMFALTAAAGQRLEPANGFFDTMRAAGAFAAYRDQESLRFLHAAATKPRWNDHAVEETRARWKLFQAAYGDRGALQKLPASWELLFPHFALLRATARMAIWHAARRERAGDDAGARAIRRDVMRLGAGVTDGSPMLIGKLVGIAIFQIGASPMPAVSGQPRASGSWEARSKATRERYAARLASSGQIAEAAWVRAQGKRLDATRAQISRVLKSNELMAGFYRLQAGWVFGLVLLKQMGVLLLLWGAAVLLARIGATETAATPPARTQWLVVYLVLFLAPCLLAASLGSLPLVVVGQGVGLALVGAVALARWIGRRSRAQDPGGDRRGGKEYAWQPALVALVALLPSTALLSLDYEAIRRGLGWAEAIEPFRPLYHTADSEAASALEQALPMLVVLPAALLSFCVLCRVAALELPLWAGLARGMRRAAPHAVALLALLYLGSLVPTVAADRALEAQLKQTTLDELGSLTQRMR